jgi:hypothetical protein
MVESENENENDSEKNIELEIEKESLEIINPPSSIDQLTLEMFMNKKQYHKYVSKTDTKKYEEHQEYLSNVAKYESRILSMTKELLKNPDHPITTDVNEAFENYIQTCIRYFRMKEWEKITESDDEPESETDEFMFTKNDNSSKKEETEFREPISSYWGKSIQKTGVGIIHRRNIHRK